VTAVVARRQIKTFTCHKNRAMPLLVYHALEIYHLADIQ